MIRHMSWRRYLVSIDFERFGILTLIEYPLSTPEAPTLANLVQTLKDLLVFSFYHFYLNIISQIFK